MRVSGNRRPRGGRPGTGNGRSSSSGGRNGSNNNNRRSNGGNRSYDSNGPDGKIRGSASQVYEKYVTLARDAQTSGDPVGAENYYQHAEHYFRIMLANNLVKPEKSSEQLEADNANGDDSDQGDEASSADDEVEVQVEKTPEVKEKPQDRNQGERNNPDEDTPSPVLEEGDAVEGEASDEAKPKTKRRVSRTRGLRRRANQRNEDDPEPSPESDDTQTVE